MRSKRGQPAFDRESYALVEKIGLQVPPNGLAFDFGRNALFVTVQNGNGEHVVRLDFQDVTNARPMTPCGQNPSFWQTVPAVRNSDCRCAKPRRVYRRPSPPYAKKGKPRRLRPACHTDCRFKV